MQFKKMAFFAIVPLILFTACDTKNNKEQEKKIIQYPTLSLDKVRGETLELKTFKNGLTFKSYENKVILVNFFASWCPPCRAEIPHLNKLREKYKKDFEIISILVSDKKSNIEMLTFIDEFNIKYPITNGPSNKDFAQHLGGIKTIPTMYLLRKDGSIMEKYKGMIPEEMLESDIQRAIQ